MGVIIIKYCASCGEALSDNDKFCKSCGNKAYEQPLINDISKKTESENTQNNSNEFKTDITNSFNTVSPGVPNGNRCGNGLGTILIMIIMAVLGFLVLLWLKGGLLPLPENITDIF